jgi:hypothetical protein
VVKASANPFVNEGYFLRHLVGVDERFEAAAHRRLRLDIGEGSGLSGLRLPPHREFQPSCSFSEPKKKTRRTESSPSLLLLPYLELTQAAG